MKIKAEHYQHMRKAMFEVLPDHPNLKYYVDNKIGIDHAKRRRWDVFSKAGLSPYVCEHVYPYANNDHIDTALRHIDQAYYMGEKP